MTAARTRHLWLLLALASGCVFDLDRVWPESGPASELGPQPDGWSPGDRRLEPRPVGDGGLPGDRKSDGPYCGDGKVGAGEECDPALAITQTCQTLGFAGGKPACGATCKIEGCYKLLDPNGKAVVALPGKQLAPAAASDGVDFWVAWEDDANAANAGDIHGARVAGSGAWSAGQVQVIATGTVTQFHPSVAFGGGKYLVAWGEPQGAPYAGGDTFGALITPQGSVGGKKLLDLCGAACDLPRLAWNGTGFLVVFIDNETGGLRGQLLDVNATPVASPIDTVAIADFAGGVYPGALASDGSSFLIAWDIYTSPANISDIRGGLVTGTGTLLHALTPIDVHSGPDDQSGPAVAFDGAGYLLVWQEASGAPPAPKAIIGRRADKAGQPVGAAFTIHAAAGDWFPAVAVLPGGGFLVTWRTDVGPAPLKRQILGAGVSSQGVLLDAAPLVISAASETIAGGPAIAGGGSTLLVVWEQAQDVWGARIATR